MTPRPNRQSILFACVTLLFAGLTSGPVFAQGPGGGGPGGGGGLDITINNITVSGNTATITYELLSAYTEDYDPFVYLLRAGTGGALADIHTLTGTSQAVHTTTANMKQPEGTFVVFIVYPKSSSEWDGVGREFTVDSNGNVTIDDGGLIAKPYLTFLGLSPMPFVSPHSYCETCETTLSRGSLRKPAKITDNTLRNVSLSQTSAGSDSSGCPTCGGGKANSNSPLDLTLKFQPQNSSFCGIAGPGFFFDNVIDAYVTAADYDTSTNDVFDNVSVRIYMPKIGKSITLRDDWNASAGTATGTLDGILEGDYAEFKTIKLVNGSGTATKNLNDASELWITFHNGEKYTFSLWDIQQSGGDNDSDYDSYARLTKVTDRCGIDSVTFTYPNANTGHPTIITDRFGNHLDLVYGQNINGVPVLTSYTYNDQGATTLTYANDFLNEITYPGGAKWKFTLTYDSITQTDKLKIESPCDGTKYYRLTADFMLYDDSIVNQPVNVLRSISNSNDDNLLSIFFNPNDAAEARIWTAGEKLALYHDDEFARYLRHYTSWTLGNISDGWDAFTNLTLESTYASHDYPPITGGTNQELAFGAAPIVVTPTGETITCTYGSSYHVESQEYDDGSYETWTYDNHFNVTRHRDRNGNVTKYVYDSCGRVTERQVGIVDTGSKTSPNDVNQSEYAIYKYAYVTSGNGEGQLKTEYTAKWTNETDMYRTDYEYDSNDRLWKVKESAASGSGSRPTTTYTYNAWGQTATVTDPVGRVTEYFYDSWGRNYKTEYHDDSTEITFYGGTGEECLPVKRKDRNGMVTKTEYDTEGRVKKVIRGYSTMAADGTNEVVNSDVLTQSITEYFYDGDSDQIDYQITDGKKTSYVYDYKYRTLEVKTYPNTGKTLTSKTVYSGNRVFYTEDPSGRREYMGYSASNSTELIRTIHCTNTTQTFADNAAVLAANRNTGLNAPYLINDAVKDAEGNLAEVIDGRNIKTEYFYDSRDREYRRLDAEGTSIEAKTETDYDKDSNVTEVRSPRYFDSNDTKGYNKAKTTYTYNGRGQRSTTTEAPGTSIAATTTTTYTLDGRVDKTTDARNNDWYSYWHTCCGRLQGNKDPAGHGSITNNDYMGRITHTAVVSDYSSHTNLHNPTDSKTLGESTTRYDILGRPIASTQWLVARGAVDENDPPIAGLDAVSAAAGITSQTIYDNNLTDNVGLDNSTGVTVNKLGGGTFSVSLSNAITKLADTVANGGANISFTANVSAGSAVVSINAEEEISFSISDGTGRTVISGQIQSHADPSPNALIVHACNKYDTVVSITGFGSVLENQSIDADGNTVKSRTDGGGRTLETVDQAGNVSTAKYDANGNVKESRDPNGVGVDIVYDDLNRPTSQTDTWGDATTTAYYLGGMVKTQTDAKSKSVTYAYDERGRRDKLTDRLNNDTTFTYDKNNNLLSITDAESRVTSYTYNSRNLKDQETYPDHSGGTSGAATYGIVEFAHDDAGRVKMKTDQSGDTVTFNYDLAGRTTQRDYRTKANSPAGTIADSDTFTFDKAGRPLTAINGRYSNTVTLTYDMAGRLKDESLTIASQTYTVSRQYNDLGQLFKQTYPDSTVIERAYTNRGQLYTVKYGSNIEDTRTYDTGGRLSTSTYRNGVVTTNNYRNSGGNKDNLISSIVTTNNGTQKIGTYTYTYDANKNKTKETITLSAINNKSFDTTPGTDPDGYDDDDRLTYWKRSDNNLTHEWTLTNVGDWSALKTNGASVSRTHSNAHEITAVGAASLTHDVKGNLTANPVRNHNYTWDFDNKMSGADTDGDTTVDISFEYDALGRRVKKGSTVYAYSGQQVIAEYPSGGAPASPTEQYVYASYVDEPLLKDGTLSSGTGLVYYSRNQQFSITGLTDASGSVVERYSYSAYGDLTIYDAAGTSIASSAYANPYTYTGRRFDSESEVYHFRARMYDPELGRFIGRDPLGYVDGMSLYRGYFSSFGIDPTGRKKLKIEISAFINGKDGIPYNKLKRSFLGKTTKFSGSDIDTWDTKTATRALITSSSWFASPNPIDWTVKPSEAGWYWTASKWYFRTDSRGKYQKGTSRAKHTIVFDTKDVGKLKGKVKVTFKNDPTYAIRHYDMISRNDRVLVKEKKAKFTRAYTVTDTLKGRKSQIRDAVSGTDPLSIGAPSLDYSFVISVNKCKSTLFPGGKMLGWNPLVEKTSVTAIFTHDKFPDYEILLNGLGVYHHRGKGDFLKGGIGLMTSNGNKSIPLGSYR